MRVVQPPIDIISGIAIDADIDMGGLYQIGNLAAPAAGEVLRKGQLDIVNADVNAAAAIDYSKLTGIPTISIVRKTADQTVNNSTVLVNDNHLLHAVGANETWLFRLYLLQQSVSTDSDFKIGWAYPVGCTIKSGAPQVRGASAGAYWLSSINTGQPAAIYTEADSQPIGTGNFTQGLTVIALVINGANAGDIVFKWAQNTATVEDTKVLTDSFLLAQQLV